MPTLKRIYKNDKITATTLWFSTTISIFGVILILLQVLGHCVLQAEAVAASRIGYYGNQEDLLEVNVTCIPFDTQFTCDCHNVDRVSGIIFFQILFNLIKNYS